MTEMIMYILYMYILHIYICVLYIYYNTAPHKTGCITASDDLPTRVLRSMKTIPETRTMSDMDAEFLCISMSKVQNT